MNIYLIRHGETDWNMQGRLQGREDIELNEIGRKQARESALALKDTGARIVLTSPLIRAVETAKIISEGLDDSTVIIEEDLIERDFGALSGMLYDRKKYFDTFGSSETSLEPFDKLSKRLINCINKNIVKYQENQEDLIMISHGAAINAVLSVLSGGNEGSGKTRLKNACINILTYRNDKLNIEFLNLSPEEYVEMKTNKAVIADKTDKYAIAVDLGTTTLAYNLVSISKGDIIGSHNSLNPQRAHGSDVVSRIKASNEGKQELLMKIIRDEILDGVRLLVNEQDLEIDNIKQIVISGNTTMIHLFMGYSCQGLGIYPYTPVNIGTIKVTSDKIFGIQKSIPITLLPSISTFVGGDIVAGLLACDFDCMEEISLFIDLGTNGEMAIGNKDRILVTSTAAGPAFEGVNISCGVGCVPGAINHISLKDGILSYETIEGEKPVGLCGTGVIELVSEFLNEGIMDETGLLEEPYFEGGFPLADMSFIQQDVRQLQLAKAAIRAGAQVLVNAYGTSFDKLDKVYIAGSFGYHLDIQKAVSIGLLTEAVMNKTKCVSNSSLSGARQVALNPDEINRLENIISSSEEIHLSNEDDFSELYIQHMLF